METWNAKEFLDRFKACEGRLVPLPARVARELAKCEAVWDYHRDTLDDRMSEIRERWNLPAAVTLQSLRRTAAFRIAHEVDTMSYARILGHSLEVAQEHYLSARAMGEGAKKNILKPSEWPSESEAKKIRQSLAK